jgi:hypothetical protein
MIKIENVEGLELIEDEYQDIAIGINENFYDSKNKQAN